MDLAGLLWIDFQMLKASSFQQLGGFFRRAFSVRCEP